MNPIPAKQVTTAKKVQRRVVCCDYGLCLEIALKQKWPGFACSECTTYEIEDPDNTPYWQVQAERCGKILKRIFVDKAPKYGRIPWMRRACT